MNPLTNPVLLPLLLFYLLFLVQSMVWYVRRRAMWKDLGDRVASRRPFLWLPLLLPSGSNLVLVTLGVDGASFILADALRSSPHPSGSFPVSLALPTLLLVFHVQMYLFALLLEAGGKSPEPAAEPAVSLVGRHLSSLALGLLALSTNGVTVVHLVLGRTGF